MAMLNNQYMFNGFDKNRATLTVYIKPTMRFKIKMRIALFLMKIAAHLIGCSFRVETE